MRETYIPNKIIERNQYKLKYEICEKTLKKLTDMIKGLISSGGLRATVKSRVKSFESYYDKMLKKLKVVSSKAEVNITDILGIRIICPFLEDVNQIENFVKSNFEIVEEIHKKDGQSFKEFGYDSTHLLIKVDEKINGEIIKENSVCEIQIRTILQDAWAEVEHELIYKNEFTPFDEPLRRKLAALNANLTLSDIIFQEIRDYQKHLHNEVRKRRDTFLEKADDTESIYVVEDSLKKENMSGEIEEEIKKSIDELLLDALYAHNTKNYEKAIFLYGMILKMNPEEFIRSIVCVHRGMAYFASSEYKNALDDFTKATEINDKNSRAYCYKGIVNRILKNYSESMDDFNKSIEIDPFRNDSHYERALLYFQIGDYIKALEDCENALKIDPDNEEARKFLLLIKSKVGGIIK